MPQVVMEETALSEPARRILDAADELFGESGFDAVSARDVARLAGVNKALVFYYFGSKELLLAAVLERFYRAHQAALARTFEETAPGPERLHGLIDAYLDFIADNRRYPRLVQREVAGSGRHLDHVRQSLTALHDLLGQALGGLCPETGPLAARQFFVTFSGAVINFFTYAPVLGPVWRGDPSAPEAVEERRAHLHWLVDVIAGALKRDGPDPGADPASCSGPRRP